MIFGLFRAAGGGWGRGLALAAVMALALAGGAQAAGPAPRVGDAAKKAADTAAGLAIAGYDVVAYYGREAPQAGAPGLSYQWQGKTWRFVSAENRQKFIAAPEKYAPQYGGYSALEMARGELVPGDPKVWSVVYGKLYFHGSDAARGQWLQAIVESIYTADMKWQKLEARMAESGPAPAAEPAAAPK